MKKIGLLSVLTFIGVVTFAAFPVEAQTLLSVTDPEKFKLDTLGFVLGLLTIWLMPYSLVLLLIRKKNFRGSLAWGWLAGLVIIALFALLFIYLLSGGNAIFFLY